jgi:hypothetical protein
VTDESARKAQEALRRIPHTTNLARLREIREEASRGGWLVPQLYAALAQRMTALKEQE